MALLLLAACGDDNNSQATPETESKAGFAAYIMACTSDGESEEICRCHAKLLSQNLPDDKIFILAEAGAAASNGDISIIDDVMNNHPDIVVALKRLSQEAENCATE